MNDKKLFLGIFNKTDMIVFISGICISLILLIIFAYMENSSSLLTIISILPAVICTILVMPLKKNHNVLGAIKQILKKR